MQLCDLSLRYVAGLLTELENKRFERHLQNCEKCRQEVEEYVSYRNLMIQENKNQQITETDTLLTHAKVYVFPQRHLQNQSRMGKIFGLKARSFFIKVPQSIAALMVIAVAFFSFWAHLPAHQVVVKAEGIVTREVPHSVSVKFDSVLSKAHELENRLENYRLLSNYFAMKL
ncbi:zf-HC2 domain-containing protein [Alicyclobacillus sp. TC]|uniref:Anti-sigma-W factor RsiW n=2 Tax=Alicyclobacillus tolerans TaxID=90970 RepID=A0A1M6JTW5_9BACL|nr:MULTISPECIES: zf-HC2 domain-containing protein [Alicyclobacillus]MDP9727405.1 anti-sigma factor RsiW [Alicyclobacillus tengchongensis]QRF23135.1 zf-HC2 domain-containing protein [Alicyclobacillus sp. TC]SHJ50062.1 Putative zinc-finger [Alicyclobacillus montanus]